MTKSHSSLVLLLSCFAAALLSAGQVFGQVGVAYDPKDKFHCWDTSNNLARSCGGGWSMFVTQAPPRNVRVNEIFYVKVNATFSDDMAEDLRVESTGRLRARPFMVRVCPRDLGLCDPRQLNNGLSHEVEGRVDLDVNDNGFQATFQITAEPIPGDYTFMAFIEVGNVFAGIPLHRSVLPAEPATSKVTSAKCHLRDPDGQSWGMVTFAASGDDDDILHYNIEMDEQAGNNNDTTSRFAVNLLRFGDLEERFGPNVALLPEAEAASEAECGALCSTGTLVSGMADGATGSVAGGLVTLIGANSIIGRGVEVVRQGSEERVASCVIEADDFDNTVSPDDNTAPLPEPASVVCSIQNAMVSGSISWEQSEVDADADKREKFLFPELNSGRGDLLISARSLADTSLFWRVTAPDGTQVPNALLGIAAPTVLDATGMAQVSFKAPELTTLHSLAGGVVELFKGESAIGEPIARCTLGSAAPGIEYRRGGPSILRGPVPQAVAGVCAMFPTAGSSSNVRGTVRMNEFQRDMRVSYDLAGLPEDSTDLVIRVHDVGEVVDAAGESMGGQTIILKQSAQSLEIEVQAGTQHASGSDAWMWYKLHGPSGLLGRSLALVDRKGNKDVLLAQCVVGRAYGSERSQKGRDFDALDSASCRLRSLTGEGVAGHVYVEQAGNWPALVSYTISGLTPGSNNRWRIHDYGELGSADLAGSVFEGAGGLRDDIGAACSAASKDARQKSMLAPLTRCEDRNSGDALILKLGSIGGDAILSADIDGVAHGRLRDPALALRGAYSILGRSIVISRSDDSGNQVPAAICTIGRSSMATVHPPTPTPPAVVVRQRVASEPKYIEVGMSRGKVVAVVFACLAMFIAGAVTGSKIGKKKNLKHSRRFTRRDYALHPEESEPLPPPSYPPPSTDDEENHLIHQVELS